jgi:hypothetical protein
LIDFIDASSQRDVSHPQRRVPGDLGELRGLLLREAARVSGATNRTLGDVVEEAASGAFTLASLKSLGTADADKIEAALRKLQVTAID